jgi:hypothetical protein
MSNTLETTICAKTLPEPLELKINCIGLDRSVSLNFVQCDFTDIVLDLHVEVVCAEVKEPDL